jgi:hypothetical protein
VNFVNIVNVFDGMAPIGSTESATYQMRQGQRTSKIVCIRAAATIRFVKCFVKEFAVQYV